MASFIRWISLLWRDPPFAWSYWMMRIADCFDPDIPSEVDEYEAVENPDTKDK